MKVTVRYFAALREALGSSEEVEVPQGITLNGMREWLIARGGPHATLLAHDRAVRSALNHQLGDGERVVTEGAEVAFFPPVTGG